MKSHYINSCSLIDINNFKKITAKHIQADYINGYQKKQDQQKTSKKRCKERNFEEQAACLEGYHQEEGSI